jgi:hypothetical protein
VLQLPGYVWLESAPRRTSGFMLGPRTWSSETDRTAGA